MTPSKPTAIGLESCEYHKRTPKGKLEIVPTKPCQNQHDLSLAYTPGVAEPCLRIHANPDDVYEYTMKGNLIAVISNGTAVLGLGNIGAAAGKPVMEGKALLFKRFADLDCIDVELATEDADKLIEAVKMMEPSFGGINLEDIKAPECFYIEERLRKEMNIPVMHDDQHGTAIISGAALVNALEILGKKISEVKIVVNGAGASAIACAKFYVELGAKRDNIIMCDTKGVIYKGRTEGMNAYKEEFAAETSARTLLEAMRGADVVLGLSVAGSITQEMVKGMAADPIIFAMANPNPEITYEDAKAARPDCIMATGRSDYPNQINNVLGFPFIFRGALDVRATQINEAMKVAAAHALADLAKTEVPDEVLKAYGLTHLAFGRDYLVPKPLDPRVLLVEPPAVAKAAMDTGVARVTVDIDTYREQLEARLGKQREMMRIVFNKARLSPRRIVMAEGENEKVVRAAHTLVEEGVAKPILLGNPEAINQMAEALNFTLDGVEIVEPGKSDKLEDYAARIFALRQRKGINRTEARALAQKPDYFAALMVETGEADGMISSLRFHYPDALRPLLQVIKTSSDTNIAAGVYMVTLKDRALFFADTTVNTQMTAEKMAQVAILTSKLAREFDMEPRVAMLSYSNFGSVHNGQTAMIQEAVKIVKQREPGLAVDGEMQADVALSQALLDEFPFNTLKKPANILIFPNLEAGTIAARLIKTLANAETVGPILVGMNKPVHIANHAETARDLVNLAALAVVEAQRKG